MGEGGGQVYAIGTSFKLRAGNASRANPTVDPLKNTTRYCKYTNAVRRCRCNNERQKAVW
jgi:hypothetical protein